MTTPRTDLLAQVNTFPAHSVQVYLVTVTATSVAEGTCTVNPEDGGLLTEVPYYGAPVVGTTTPMILFDGQLAVLGLPATYYPLDVRDAWTAQPGWSVTYQQSRLVAPNLLHVDVQITRTGAPITLPPSGDLANTSAAVLDPSRFPVHGNLTALTSSSAGRLCGWAAYNNDNDVALVSAGGTTAIATSEGLSFGGIIPLRVGY